MATMLISLLLISCDATIHFYPEPEAEPEPEDTQCELVIHYNIDLTPPTYYKVIEYNSAWERSENELAPDAAPVHNVGDAHELHIVIEVYTQDSRRFETAYGGESRTPMPVRRYDLYSDHDVDNIEGEVRDTFPKDEYYILAWAHYVERDVRELWHYFPDNLNAVTTDLATYPGNTHLREAFAGNMEFALNGNQEVDVNLVRPNGRYRLIATDLINYYINKKYNRSNLSDLTLRVTYRMFVGVEYNVYTSEPSDFIESYSFTIPLKDEDISMVDGTASLGIDYIFSGDQRENHVVADFSVLDADGDEVNTVSGIDIPLRRNRETVIKGNFLTKPLSEGMSINENFENETVIHF